MHISPSVKSKRRDEVVKAVHDALLPGEQPLVLVSIARIRRPADFLALTDRRVLTWSCAPLNPVILVDDIDGASITDVNVRQDSFGKTGRAEIVTAAGKVNLGPVQRTTREELQYLAQTLRWLMTVPPTEHMRAQRHAQLAATLGDREAALATATNAQRKALATEFRQADDADLLREAQTYGDGKVTKPLLRTIRELCRDGERPWFVLVSWGEGALVAFEDRAVVIKVGAVTAMVAGAMGGGRVATFHLSDITGIEYNSGMLTGVLEVLTPSYQGTANKDYWRGSNRSRNADANDPHTLSNTLPLAKLTYKAALPGLNELRERIGRAKQTNVIVTGQPAAQPAAPSVTDEITRLAELHRAGVLTDEEFNTAKAALISRL